MRRYFRSYITLFFLVVSAAIFLSGAGARTAFAFNTISDTISTSRPSASTPVGTTGSSSSDSQIAVNTVNSSRYLASDSAKLINSTTGAQVVGGLIVASQSADLSTVYLGNTTGTIPQKGVQVLLMPITALHKVQFKTTYQMTSGGTDTLTLTFPGLASGDANNPASASASTFQLNGLSSTTIQIYDGATDVTGHFTVSITNPTAGTSPIITFANLATASIPAGDTVTIYIGCTTSTSASCSVQTPRIINPTKTATAGTADSWKIRLAQSGSAVDSATFNIATIESVTVRATVDPSLSFTIAGLASATDINSGNTGCSISGAGHKTNSGITATATEANLGVVQNTAVDAGALSNISAQTLTVSTNGSNGYSLTATSSSGLLNPETGFYFRSSTTPIAFPNASATPAHFFGLHPCGVDVNTSWIQGGATGGSTCNLVTGSAASNCFWAWPTTGVTTNTTPLTIASAAVGPIGSGNGTAGSGIVSVAYSAGTDVTVPPGQYRSVITYIATPAF